MIDDIEEYCCNKWREVFKIHYHVNVQPHSGSSANMAAYQAFLKPGDRVLSMSLDEGGHLFHGSAVNFSGKLYEFKHYSLTKQGVIDYEALELLVREWRPHMVVAGVSAYSRETDFARIKAIIDSCSDNEYKPWFMVDMAHIAGLVAAGVS